MTFQPDEGMMTMSGTSGASGEWYKTEGNAWKVDTQTAAPSRGQGVPAAARRQVRAHQPRWDPSFDASINKGQLIGTVAAAWEAPLFISSAGGTGKGEWKVAQLPDWFGNGTKTGSDGGSGVAVLKARSTRPRP